jgi:hypothetical protein
VTADEVQIVLIAGACAASVGLAGLGAGDMQAHRDLGWILHLPILLILVAALLARVGRPTIWWVVAFFVSGAIQPILATMDDLPAIAALPAIAEPARPAPSIAVRAIMGDALGAAPAAML